MEAARDRIVSLSTASGAAEEWMLGADLVSEMFVVLPPAGIAKVG